MTRVVAFLQPGWADWEAGPVLALLREHFGAETRVATLDGEPAVSIGGLSVSADCSFADVGPSDAEVWLLIGSAAWETYEDQAFFEQLRRADAADRIVGAICGGTVAAARAGLLDGRAHTSNGPEWLREHAPGYLGAEGYVDQPAAVSDRHLVTASGLAPHTFAAAVARLVAPEQAGSLTVYEHLYGREFERAPESAAKAAA